MEINRYIFRLKRVENTLWINLLNGIALLLSKDIDQILENKELDLLEKSSEDLLIQCGFLLDENEDLQIRNENILALNLNLTNACNFTCDYCYFRANNEQNVINSINEDRFIKCIVQTMKEKPLNIYVNYLGGEPLIESEKLCRISNKIKLVANKNHKEYLGEVTTNGFYLNKELALNLAQAGIKEIQITFDGGPIGHDLTRHCINHGGSYQKILNNISECKDIISIVIRINIHKKTIMSDIEKLLIDLKNIGIVKLYFATIERNDENEDKSLATSDDESLKLYSEVWELQKKQGFVFIQKIPSIIGNCIAKNQNGHTINFDGKMYMCPSTCGCEKYYQNTLYELEKFPLKDKFKILPKCKECEFYPICMGGCEKQNLNRKDKKCRKQFYADLLELYFEKKYF